MWAGALGVFHDRHIGAWAHYLPLDQCDFYFQGHRDNVPMLDVLDSRNITASPPILTK